MQRSPCTNTCGFQWSCILLSLLVIVQVDAVRVMLTQTPTRCAEMQGGRGGAVRAGSHQAGEFSQNPGAHDLLVQTLTKTSVVSSGNCPALKLGGQIL